MLFVCVFYCMNISHLTSDYFVFFLSKSRNQLSTLPVHLCSLPLKVLIASNNKLVSIPEEIGHLRQLTELVSMHLISNYYYSALGLRMICVATVSLTVFAFV